MICQAGARRQHGSLDERPQRCRLTPSTARQRVPTNAGVSAYRGTPSSASAAVARQRLKRPCAATPVADERRAVDLSTRRMTLRITLVGLPVQCRAARREAARRRFTRPAVGAVSCRRRAPAYGCSIRFAQRDNPSSACTPDGRGGRRVLRWVRARAPAADSLV